MLMREKGEVCPEARRKARARFSSMVMLGAVPLRGSWNRWPITLLRLNSGVKVMSSPPRTMQPSSAMKPPVMALNRVDLPAPLEPTMVAKSPFSRARSTPSSATFSFTVPGLKVLRTPFISSISIRLPPFCRGSGRGGGGPPACAFQRQSSGGWRASRWPPPRSGPRPASWPRRAR